MTTATVSIKKLRLHQIVPLGLLIGLTMFIIGTMFYLIVPFAMPQLEKEYNQVALFRPWSGWTRYYMILHPFWFGLVFTAIFQQLDVPPGARYGAAYGLIVFVGGSLPIFMLNYASFAVSSQVIATWIIQNAVQYVVAGAVLGKLQPVK